MPEIQSPTSTELYPNPYPADLSVLAVQIEELSLAHHRQEIEWVEKRPHVSSLSDRDILSEYAHVVYASGFRAETVYAKWEDLRQAYYGWDATRIRDHRNQVRSRALAIINNTRKVDSILKFSDMIYSAGIDHIRTQYLSSVSVMEQLPFIGPVLKYHLARNLGFDVVKPDLHLLRLTKHYRFGSPYNLCLALEHEMLQSWRLATVDLMTWRYCAAHGTLSIRDD